MTRSARALNRATLARQLLLRREPLDVPSAVRHLVGLQAQEPASPYLALWSRVADLDPADVDEAFADGTLVKATLLRITLHAVHVDDHPWLHGAMRPTLRGARLGGPRFVETGLTPADADALVADLLGFVDEPRSNAEVVAWLTERHGDAAAGAWWALRGYAPLRHAVTGGPWSFGRRPAHVAARTPAASAMPDELLTTLVRRYLVAFGPASVADVAQYALVPRTRARAAIAALGDELVHLHGPDGLALVDVPDAPLPDEDTPAPPRLLAMWDSTLLAYADRSRVVPDRFRALAIRRNGDVLPTVLVDGHVAGVWRTVEEGIEVSAFEPLPAEAWDGLADEARSLVALLADRDPAVYGRYGHWWDKLPAPAERTVLP